MKNKRSTKKIKGGLRDLIDINKYGHVKIKRAVGLLDFNKQLTNDSRKDSFNYDKTLENLIIEISDNSFQTFYGVGSFLSGITLGSFGDIKNIEACSTKVATYSIIRRSVMDFLITNKVMCQSIVSGNLILFTVKNFNEPNVSSIKRLGQFQFKNIRSRAAAALLGSESAYSYTINIKYKIDNYQLSPPSGADAVAGAGTGVGTGVGADAGAGADAVAGVGAISITNTPIEEIKGSLLKDAEFWYNFKPYVPINLINSNQTGAFKVETNNTVITNFVATTIKKNPDSKGNEDL